MADTRNIAERFYAYWLKMKLEHGGPYRNPHAYQGTQARNGGFGSRQQRAGAGKAEARAQFVARRAAARGR